MRQKVMKVLGKNIFISDDRQNDQLFYICSLPQRKGLCESQIFIFIPVKTVLLQGFDLHSLTQVFLIQKANPISFSTMFCRKNFTGSP